LHTKTLIMKINLKFPVMIIAVVLIQSCASNENKDTGNDTTAIDSIRDSTVLNSPDHTHEADANDETTFLKAAALGGLMEVEAANAASTQSKNSAVKDFATLMLKDHGKANKEVKELASKLLIAIPTALPAEHLKHLREMKRLNDHKFDQQYITMMLSDHAKTVKLFTAGQRLANPGVKAFAIKTLPIIQAHYDKAVAIGKTLNLSNVNNGDDLQGVSPSAGESN
jgi:putative membrane protein